jgi:hypothetical protein
MVYFDDAAGYYVRVFGDVEAPTKECCRSRGI